MSQSDKTLAFATGAATGSFKIADRKFKLQAMFVTQVNEYLEPETDKAAYIVACLNERIADRGDPIDREWLESHVTYAEFSAITNLLISGGVTNPNG